MSSHRSPSARRAKKRRVQARAMQAAERRLGPDQSTVLHTFEDGWSIRRPSTVSDVRREGVLMRHCLAEPPAPDSDDPPLDWWIEAGVCSLRDEQNFPHVTFAHFHGHGLIASGRAETDPKPVYMARIESWLATLPPPPKSRTECFVVVTDDGRAIFEDEADLLRDAPPGGQLYYVEADGEPTKVDHYCYLNAPVYEALGVTAKAHLAAMVRGREFTAWLLRHPGVVPGLTSDEAFAAATTAMDEAAGRPRIWTASHAREELAGQSHEQLLARLQAGTV